MSRRKQAQHKHALVIKYQCANLGYGTGRYHFRISPLKPDSGVFQFFRYILIEDVDKENPHHNRVAIARDLRVKHAATWERYHRWEEE